MFAINGYGAYCQIFSKIGVLDTTAQVCVNYIMKKLSLKCYFLQFLCYVRSFLEKHLFEQLLNKNMEII
jgi:hypothetical protein